MSDAESNGTEGRAQMVEAPQLIPDDSTLVAGVWLWTASLQYIGSYPGSQGRAVQEGELASRQWAMWPGIVTLSALGVILVTFLDVAGPIRNVIALWFLFVCPGMPYVRLLKIRHILFEGVLAIALSLTLAVLVSVAMLYAGAWSPETGLMILVGLSLLGVSIELAQVRRRSLPVDSGEQ